MKRDLAAMTLEEMYKTSGGVTASVNKLVRNIEKFSPNEWARLEVERLVEEGGGYAIQGLLEILRSLNLRELSDEVEKWLQEVVFYEMDEELSDRYSSWHSEVEHGHESALDYKELKKEGRWIISAFKALKKKGRVAYKNPDEDYMKKCGGFRNNCDTCYSICCEFNQNHAAEKEINQTIDLDRFLDEQEARRRYW